MSAQRGHLKRVGNAWRLVVRSPRGPGLPRKQTSVRMGSLIELPNRKAAREAADRWLEREHPTELHAGTVYEWSKWCDRYIDRCLPMLAQGSRETQTSIIQSHLRQAFHGPVHLITTESVQEFLVEQRKAGVAPSTVRSRFAVLRRMLRQAAAEGLAVTAPIASSVTLPKDDRVHNAVREKAFTAEEVARIFDHLAAEDAPDLLAYELALYLGLRCGETLGLAWSQIDLHSGAITVRQQAVDGAIRPLKTKDSKATLRAPQPLLDSLRAYHAIWVPNERQLLFADEQGKPMKSVDLRNRLHELLAELGIRRRGMHAWRHACALGLARAGCNPEVIRRAMRHSSMAITQIYLEAAPEDVAVGLERAAHTWKAPA